MISIVVPVYNTGKYLPRCLKSIIHQTFSDFELLLIDDGSTDNSGTICDDYAKIDRRITVIHKHNEGSSKARNVGISLAKRKYISFIDSDDWLDLDFYEVMMKSMDGDVDICISGMIQEGKSTSKVWKYQVADKMKFSGSEALWIMLNRRYFCWELCDKIYKRSLFDGVMCNETLSVGEDFAINWKLFQKANEVTYISLHGYHYRMHPESMIHKKYNEKHIFLDTLQYVMQDYETMKPNVKEFMLKWYTHHLFYEILNIFFWKMSLRLRKGEFYRSQIVLWLNEIQNLCSLNRREMLLLQSVSKEIKKCESDFYRQYSRMCFRIRKKCNGCNKIYIYGTGKLSEYVIEIMRRNRLNYDGFVVSDDQNPSTVFEGYPIYKLSNLRCDVNKIVFFLAVNEDNKKEIVNNLKKAGYRKFYWPELCRFSI